MSATVGNCALCGSLAEIRESHYLSAAFFRRLHGEDDDGEVTFPISMNADRLMYNCNQPTAQLLCDACEHRFKVQGKTMSLDAPRTKMAICFSGTCQLRRSAQRRRAS